MWSIIVLFVMTATTAHSLLASDPYGAVLGRVISLQGRDVPENAGILPVALSQDEQSV